MSSYMSSILLHIIICACICKFNDYKIKAIVKVVHHLKTFSEVNVNLADISGVTPLGHQSVVAILMDTSTSCHIQIDTQENDDSDYTAVDYAKSTGNRVIEAVIRQKDKKSAVTSDIRALNKDVLANNEASRTRPVKTVATKGTDADASKANAVSTENSNLSSIQKFANEIRSLQTESELNLTAISSTRSVSRCASELSSGSPSDTQLSDSNRCSKEENSKLDSTLKTQFGTADDEELELSSIRELMGTVREAAKEIRAIVEPMQRECERLKTRSHEHTKRCRQKKKEKRNNSGQERHIQTQVNVTSKINGKTASPMSTRLPENKNSLAPSAYLTVENEEMSNTWPRKKCRSVSRDRTGNRSFYIFFLYLKSFIPQAISLFNSVITR